eukprot:CAMPEP_0113625238 /NCGR_PEP_ID=MMETSP0017_2-20120614/13036_1 /TAXON_ID=2856 /ORGANISM="Cylindrotheca closterium" /LENGTH=488 /DNA_ID=CAMNT_0000535345 /DNA_START=29 /DNA_END=1492 /DNA_ORIENTATION=- /assembly_acc=CAM_ASM_000147
MTDTAKSIRLSLKQQLRESKIDFSLLPMPKKPGSKVEKKKSKLRMKRPSMPSRVLPKCVFSRGPIAYGLVPRPKKPDGYDPDLKSSKPSRRSMMTRDASNLTHTDETEERGGSNRSLQSLSSVSMSDSCDESLNLEDLMENISTETEEENQSIQRNGSRSTLRSSVGRTGRSDQNRSSNTIQNSSSNSLDLEELMEEKADTFNTEGNQCSQRNGSRRTLNRSVSSSRSIGRTGRIYHNRSSSSIQNSSSNSLDLEELFEGSVDTYNEGNQRSQRNGSRRSLQRSVSSSRSIGRTGRSFQNGSSSTLQSSPSNRSLNCSSSSFKGRTAKRESLLSPPRMNTVEPPALRGSSRNFQSFNSSGSLENSVSSFGGRRESTTDKYPVIQGLRRETRDVEDELEITNHSVASQGHGRRKKRPSAQPTDCKQQETGPSAQPTDCKQQETETFRYGTSARNRKSTKVASTMKLSECRSWVFWTEDVDGCANPEPVW